MSGIGNTTAHSAYNKTKDLVENSYENKTQKSTGMEESSSTSQAGADFKAYLQNFADASKAGEAATKAYASGQMTPDIIFAVSNWKQQVEELSAVLKESRDAVNRITSMNV